MLSPRPRSALLFVSWRTLGAVLRPRPAAQACLGLMAGVACAEFGIPPVRWSLLGLVGLGGMVMLFPRLWVIALAFAIGWARYTAWNAPNPETPPQQALLRAVGMLEPTRNGFRLLCAFEAPARDGYALVYFRSTVSPQALPDYGDRFRLDATWSQPRNWVGVPFDWVRYLQRRQIRFVAFVYHAGQVQLQESGTNMWQRRLGRARRNLREVLSARLSPATASITEGMMMGASGDFPPDLREAFMRSGIGHLLSTSGLHVAMVLQMIGGLLLWLGISFRLRMGVVIAFAWFYALLAGLRPNMVRAGMMATLALSAPFVRREADGLSALSVAGIVWLIYAPYSLFEAGFQYSFAAVLCILLFYGHVLRVLVEGWQAWVRSPMLTQLGVRWLCPLLSVTLCAQLGTAPVQLYHFGYFGWFSTVANLLAVPVSYPLLAVGFLFWAIQGWLGGILLEWLCNWLCWVATTFGSAGAPMLTISHLPAWIPIGFYVGLLLLAREPQMAPEEM